MLVRSEVEQPIWINEDGSTNARRLIAMQNGLLDLDALLAGESAVLKENTPRWFSSVGLDYQFDAQGTCPRWLAFLDRCLASNQELIALLQEWFGYCLTHDTSQQKAMFFEGDGANGKSVAVLTLEQVVGKANTSNVPLEVFGQRFQLTSTLGKLVNICGDTGELDKVAEGFIKQFTGGDTMYFDRKHISSIKAKPTARLLVVTNNRPRFSDRSGGIWRRIILMPWRVTIPEKDQDKRLVCPDSHDWPFREELSGIFNWAVEGLRRLRKRGRFEVPASCREAVEEYRLECNPAREFLNECCEAKPGQRVQVTELYKHYEGWCKTRGYRALGLAAFGKEVGRCFPAAKKTRPTISGKRVSCYEGLAMEDGGS